MGRETGCHPVQDYVDDNYEYTPNTTNTSISLKFAIRIAKTMGASGCLSRGRSCSKEHLGTFRTDFMAGWGFDFLAEFGYGVFG